MSSKDNQFISPIAIDLGAKNTGVYYAHYLAGISLDKFREKANPQGKVYTLEKNAYTLMMVSRTTSRHQRRGYDRRQMAKRLFKLIWTEHFNLDWNEDVQKVVGFLFNRRGFSFVTEGFDPQRLEQFPQDIFNKFPQKVKDKCEEVGDNNSHSDEYDLNTVLQIWLEEDNAEEKLKQMYEEFETTYRSEYDIKKSKKTDKEYKSYFWQFEGKKAKISPAKFSLEKASEQDWFDGESSTEAHLSHFIFAIKNLLNELQSGGRHRTKYFEEIKDVLECKTHNYSFLKNFCDDLQNGKFSSLNPGNLTNLIGHLSNFELKPLRKYFNNIKHKSGDKWDEKELGCKFKKWICNDWRVNPEKDKKKRKDGPYDYNKLKDKWKNHKDNVVDFWLNLCPAWTVPPYQDNNNRRPPKCQSLILSPNFLTLKYPDWKNWLKTIKELPEVKDYLEDFEDSLKSLKTRKGNSYFQKNLTGDKRIDSEKLTYDNLNARVLQFIFDRVKRNDPLNLNEIYSTTKKIKQLKINKKDYKEKKECLEDVLRKSLVPDNLKIKPDFEKDDIFSEGTFLHLVCRYYKLRQKAKDGRIYIHPEYRLVKDRGYENTGRFDKENHLLTYCNHKPRQKRYQLLYDLANLLQVSPDLLENHVSNFEAKTTDEKLFKWLDGISGLKSNCANAAKEQKDKRGYLKSNIQRVYGLLYYHKKNDEDLKSKEIKQILKKSKVKTADGKGAFNFYSFIERVKGLCLQVTENLYDEKKYNEFSISVGKNPASAVYFLAQINNLVFKERSGNAKTCAVCSTDNAKRMTKSKDTTKAQRLPAISTRLIDGAVMRLARILGTKIAEDKWSSIKEDLKNNQICVPIVTESNSFEFEPSLRSIKENPKKGKSKEVDANKLYQDKKDRIKSDGGGISPYSGESVSDGDLDHIIPRSSNRDTLNDEANLIFTSEEDNRTTKGSNEFSLSNLHQNYKKELFGNKSDEDIKSWIKDQIGDGEAGKFKFGQYKSFINLSSDEQKAFRHALFLIGCPLRENVINAIDNRTRTFVNGTQRYFAEVIANNIYKKAKKEGLEKKLSFDYFGVETGLKHEDGTVGLRDLFCEAEHEIINDYKKEGGQKPYSHLIDAQLAFCIALNRHKNDGTFKLNVSNSTLEPVDLKTGEIKATSNTIFDKALVNETNFDHIKLERRKPRDRFSKHRSYTRDTFYSMNFLPILIKKNKNVVEVKVGFNWDENSVAFPEKEKHLNITLTKIIPICKYIGDLFKIEPSEKYLDNLYDALAKIDHYNIQLKKYGYFYLNVDKQKFNKDLFENCNTTINLEKDKLKIYDLCIDKIGYRTEKIAIEEGYLEKPLKDKDFQIKIDSQIVTLPAKKEWLKISYDWKNNKEKNFSEFIKTYFKNKCKKHSHQKVRKVFSLPRVTGEGRIFLKRSSWSGTAIYQVINDSDSRKVDAKPYLPVRTNEGLRNEVLSTWARSKNFVKLPLKESNNIEGEYIDPEDWWILDKNHHKEWPGGVENIWYRIDDNTSPSIKLQLSVNGSDFNPESLDHSLCKHGFRKQKARKATRNSKAIPAKSPSDMRDEFFESQIKHLTKGSCVEYKGASYSKTMDTAFKTSTNVGKYPERRK